MVIEINVIVTDDVKCKVLNSPKLIPVYMDKISHSGDNYYLENDYLNEHKPLFK